MVRGIAAAAAGMMAQMDGTDVTANNLANANTAGYKRDVASFGVTLAGAIGSSPDQQIQVSRDPDLSQGSMQQTDEPFHLALDGDGFFSVQTPTGVGYTRNGSFTMSPDGYLVTHSGDQVLGSGGPIKLAGANWRVDDRGQVFENGARVDTLQVVRFPSPTAVAKAGQNRWTASVAPMPMAAGTRVRQGFLESSNVNTIQEMVSMISGYRAYEACQKVVQAQDETLDKAVNDVGRIG